MSFLTYPSLLFNVVVYNVWMVPESPSIVCVVDVCQVVCSLCECIIQHCECGISRYSGSNNCPNVCMLCTKVNIIHIGKVYMCYIMTGYIIMT